MDAMTAYRHRKLVMEKYHGLCGYCLIRTAAHVHEIVPRSAGGDLIEPNQIALCPACHDQIHATGWDKHTEQLYEAQRRAQTVINPAIIAGPERT